MNAMTTGFLLTVLTATTGVASERSTLSPAEAIVGEWRSATKTFAPDSEYLNSREYFSPIDPVRKTGIRTLKGEDGKTESFPYSILREDRTNRALDILIHLPESRKRKVVFKFEESWSQMLQSTYLTDAFHVETHHVYVGGDLPVSPKAEAKPKGNGKPYTVRVAVNDDTQRNPVNAKAEIWFQGHGSWWLKPELKFGVASKNLGTRPSGTEQNLIIYPDSRDGKEFKIPYMMTDEMNPNGSPRDMISVDISDTEIIAFGLPIKAATGRLELKYKR